MPGGHKNELVFGGLSLAAQLRRMLFSRHCTKWARRLAILVMGVLTCGTASALEIKAVNRSNMILLRLNGQFLPGDGLKIRGEISRLPRNREVLVELNAAGGSAREAMSIGRLLYQIRARAIVPPKASCLSPCPLALVGSRSADAGQPAQIKHSSARFGFTRFLASSADREYTVKDMDATVANTQRAILEVADYLVEVGANLDLLRYYYDEDFVGGARVLSDDEVLSLGISVFDDAAERLVDAKALEQRQ